MLSLEETVARAVDVALNNEGKYFMDRNGNMYLLEPLWRFDGDKSVNHGRYVYALRFSSGYEMHCGIITAKRKDEDILSTSYGREKLISLIPNMVEWRERKQCLP